MGCNRDKFFDGSILAGMRKDDEAAAGGYFDPGALAELYKSIAESIPKIEESRVVEADHNISPALAEIINNGQ